jgi:hypothetical protein
VLHPTWRFLRALGRTPDLECEGRPDPERVLALVRRLLVEGGVDAAWVCSAPGGELAAQVAAAEACGVPVEVPDEEQVGALLLEGEAVEQRARRALMASVPSWVDGAVGVAGQRAERRLSAEAVVLVWLRGADGVLGARALPLPPPDGQGNRHAQRARIDAAGSALAFAGGVMREAMAARRWPRRAGRDGGGAGVDVGAVVLRAVLLGGCSFAEAAQAAGLGNAMAAHRAQGRALDCVRDVLAERRERG